jgi:hypothetical protein
MKKYLISRCVVPPYLILALDGGEWPVSHPGCFTPGLRANGYHWIRGWVGPTDGLDAVEKTIISCLVVQLYKIFPEFCRSEGPQEPQIEHYFSHKIPFLLSRHISLILNVSDYGHFALIDNNWFHESSSIGDSSVNVPNFSIMLCLYCSVPNCYNFIKKIVKGDKK